MKRTMFLALLLATPAMAQQSQDPNSPRQPLPADRGYDKPQARTDAINAAVRPELAPATAAANAQTLAKDAAVASSQASYDYDMANYLNQLRARDATAAGNEAQYAAKQRAYADAMRVWRQQVRDCDRGSITACRAPTPDPAAFY